MILSASTETPAQNDVVVFLANEGCEALTADHADDCC
jgi:hypothetical protein